MLTFKNNKLGFNWYSVLSNSSQGPLTFASPVITQDPNTHVYTVIFTELAVLGLQECGQSTNHHISNKVRKTEQQLRDIKSQVLLIYSACEPDTYFTVLQWGLDIHSPNKTNTLT
ncbi:hypothetical protein XENORESO_018974 [Xenotaenia resolanae]|uniref:Uncharacterized protein n=1 Tax=Xenotaenia resolanae TaxID=208358 RepID=A0ABV0VV22_9TELE